MVSEAFQGDSNCDGANCSNSGEESLFEQHSFLIISAGTVFLIVLVGLLCYLGLQRLRQRQKMKRTRIVNAKISNITKAVRTSKTYRMTTESRDE